MKNNTTISNSISKALVSSSGYHWSCMPARCVTRNNVESFIMLLDRTEVSYIVAEVTPRSSFGYTVDESESRGFELLHDTGVMRIRVRVEFERLPKSAAVDEVPVRADLEIEKDGIRRNYYSVDTEAILRVLRHVQGIAQRHDAEKAMQDQINELRVQAGLNIVRTLG